MNLICVVNGCKSHEQDPADRLFRIQVTVHRDGTPSAPITQIPHSLFECAWCAGDVRPYQPPTNRGAK